MIFRMKNILIPFLLIGLTCLTIFINGCKSESNPVIAQSEHFDPEGWVIRDATTKPILVVWQGEIQTEWNGKSISDTLYAPSNALSDHYSIKFLDTQKNLIDPPSDTDHSFGWNIKDTSYLSIVQDSPTDWAFHLRGKKNGTTSIELLVEHAGHVDVRTPFIPVIVEEDTTKYGEPVGVRISLEENNEELANATSGNTTGIIEVRKDSTTDHLEVEFVDANGKYFQPEYPLHQLSIENGDNTIAEILPESNESWVFRIKGLKTGSTFIKVKLIVNSTAEFTSANISLKVNP